MDSGFAALPRPGMTAEWVRRRTLDTNDQTRGNAMDQSLKSPASVRPRRRLPCPVRRLARRAPAELRCQDRPAAAAARRDRGERGALRAGDLGRFRPPRRGRDHHRRDAVPLCRDQARRKAPEEMDGAAARPHRAAIHAGQEPPDPAAARRGRHHRALELSAAADAGARDRRDRRRQPRDDQAGRADAAFLGALEGGDRAKIRSRPSCWSPASRTRWRRRSRRCRSII